MSDHRYFFCSGPPKSGTTLLQHCLHTHPHVVCPSEHRIEILLSGFDQLFTEYNRALRTIDQRTGGFGAELVSSETAAEILRLAVTRMMDQFSHGAQVAGLNDNSLLPRLDFFSALFADAKWLLIFRHPIPRAISAWHHNHRLAAEESNPAHLLQIQQAGSLDAWALQLARDWKRDVLRIGELLADSARFLVIRYEDLVIEKASELQRIFNFLEVPTTAEEIQRICQLTDFRNMKARAKRPKFLRAGGVAASSNEISPETVAKIQAESAEALQLLGYSVSGDCELGALTLNQTN
ncbi:MAG: sulfotransferase [Planctomycetales bacterium]|nr:sulfotransferase [Planctomycetales bacterium]